MGGALFSTIRGSELRGQDGGWELGRSETPSHHPD